MLLHRYGNIDYVMSLEFENGLEIVTKAMEKERDERIFQQWVVQLPAMAMTDKVMSFEDYRDRVTGANIDRRSTRDILLEMDEVEREFEKGGES